MGDKLEHDNLLMDEDKCVSIETIWQNNNP